MRVIPTLFQHWICSSITNPKLWAPKNRCTCAFLEPPSAILGIPQALLGTPNALLDFEEHSKPTKKGQTLILPPELIAVVVQKEEESAGARGERR